MEKYYGIQYLRGFAAVYVMLFHLGSLCGIELTGTGGRTARLFFVISGFIITWTFRRTQEPPLTQLKRYAIRRGARIYPPYWIVLAVTLPLFLLGFSKGAWWHRDPLNIVQNIFLIQPPHQNIVFVSWSLVFEIFFYSLFGFAIILLGIPVINLCAVWAALILGAMFFAPTALPDFIITSDYNLYFIAGCLLAEYHRWKPIKWTWPVFAALLVIYIVLPFFTLNEFIALFLSLFLVASSLGCFNGEPNKFFLLLGEASYSIYLVHGLTAVTIHRLTHEKIPYLVLLAVTFGVTMAFYHFIELPMLNHFRNRQKKRTLTPGEIKVAPVP
jgi:exopolysaccharide production protein ExoZ